jgi:hypothetical protein
MIRLKLNYVEHSLLGQGSFCYGVVLVSLGTIFVNMGEQFIAHKSEFVLRNVRQKLTVIAATKFPSFDSKTPKDFENRLFSLAMMDSDVNHRDQFFRHNVTLPLDPNQKLLLNPD